MWKLFMKILMPSCVIWGVCCYPGELPEDCNDLHFTILLDNTFSMKNQLESSKRIAIWFVEQISIPFPKTKYTLIVQTNETYPRGDMCELHFIYKKAGNVAEGSHVNGSKTYLLPMIPRLTTIPTKIRPDSFTSSQMIQAIKAVDVAEGLTAIPYGYTIVNRLRKETISNAKNVVLYIGDGENGFRFTPDSVRIINRAVQTLTYTMKAGLFTIGCSGIGHPRNRLWIPHPSAEHDTSHTSCYDITNLQEVNERYHLKSNLRSWTQPNKTRRHVDCCDLSRCKPIYREVIGRIVAKVERKDTGCRNIINFLDNRVARTSGLTYKLHHGKTHPQCHYAIPGSRVFFYCKEGKPTIRWYICKTHGNHQDSFNTDWSVRWQGRTTYPDTLNESKSSHWPACVKDETTPMWTTSSTLATTTSTRPTPKPTTTTAATTVPITSTIQVTAEPTTSVRIRTTSISSTLAKTPVETSTRRSETSSTSTVLTTRSSTATETTISYSSTEAVMESTDFNSTIQVFNNQSTTEQLDNATSAIVTGIRTNDPQGGISPSVVAAIVIVSIILFVVVVVMLLYRRRIAKVEPRSKSDGVQAKVAAKSERGQVSLESTDFTETPSSGTFMDTT